MENNMSITPERRISIPMRSALSLLALIVLSLVGYLHLTYNLIPWSVEISSYTTENPIPTEMRLLLPPIGMYIIIAMGILYAVNYFKTPKHPSEEWGIIISLFVSFILALFVALIASTVSLGVQGLCIGLMCGLLSALTLGMAMEFKNRTAS